MTILFSLDNYDRGTGGAAMCARGLARRLAERGHRVHVLQRGEAVGAYDDGPVRVHTRPLPTPRVFRERDRDTLRWNRLWRPMLEDFLREHSTALVITQNRLLYSTVSVATERGLPVIVLVHAFSMFCPTQFRSREALHECDRGCKRCLPWRLRWKYGTTKQNLDRYEEGCRAATLLIANSRYTQSVIRRFYDIDSEVVYPTTDLQLHGVEGSGRDSVLFVKPQYVKGFPIFVEIARRMPDTRFLVAGRPRRHARMRLRRLENAECLGWVEDMREAYARTRVVLGPSIWPEPFGRVFVEAAVSGIPSVASARGGIPEAVGDGGILIDEIFDIAGWLEALRRLEDSAVYEAYSTKAREHARQFAAEATVQQFIESVRNVLGLEL